MEDLKILRGESKKAEIVPLSPAAGPGATAVAYEFAPFRVDLQARLLLREGTPIPLTPKVFDTLVVLVANSGRLLSKDELMQAVWPDAFVEELNLTQNISVLRKAIGDSPQAARYIVTVAGRGYRFAKPVHRLTADDAQVHKPATPVSSSHPLAPVLVKNKQPSWLPIRPQWLIATIILAAVAVYISSRWNRQPHVSTPSLAQEFRIGKLSASGAVLAAAISPDGRYIASIESDGGEDSLWVRQTATGGRAQVLPPQEKRLGSVAFSPDGNELYFTRIELDVGYLYRMASLGGAPRLVARDVDTPVTFSPDGKKIAFMRGDPLHGQFHIVIAGVEGGADTILATLRRPVEFEFAGPAWSPDGNNIAASVQDYSAGRHWAIHIISVADGKSREIYRSQSMIGRLRWRPDGKGLLTVISESPSWPGVQPEWQQEGGQVWQIAYPTGEARRITNDVANYDPCCLDVTADGKTMTDVQIMVVSNLYVATASSPTQPTQITSGPPVARRHSWLPDNRTILYRDTKGDLYRIGRDERAPMLITPPHHVAMTGPSACGDGRYVVFQSVTDREGFGIWRMEPNGANPQKLVDLVPPVSLPQCSADGKWVYYAADHAERFGVMRVPIEGGTPSDFRADAYSLFPSPSGRFYLYWPAYGQPPGNVWVVEEAATERRQQLPPLRDGAFGAWAPDESGLDFIVTRNGVSNIWRVPLNGGPARQLTHFPTGRIFSMAWSPDGKWLSLVHGDARSDLVLLQYAH